MRLVQVAKALGMTGQELRHELTQVNFGVKPTDREVPDVLAKGVIRFLARKRGITVDLEALGLEEEGGESESAVAAGREAGTLEKQEEQEGLEHAKKEAPTVHAPAKAALQEQHHDGVAVLRKLSLENVSKEAIAQHERELKKSAQVSQGERPGRPRRPTAPGKRKESAATAAVQEQIKKKEGVVWLPEMITVKELAEKTGVQVPLFIQALMKNGVMATINQTIDYETAAVVAAELGIVVQREQRAANVEDLISRNLTELLKDDPEHLVPRPPIIVVMGHVDHGKTAILDAIRKTNVVSKEAGGITQHIGAYQVEVPSGVGDGRLKKITFLDTPGHEAFTAMRARGAQVTDVAVIVVSAEEGVKATTIEAINHAKEADVPILVALNKIDKERADPDRVKGELAAQGLQPEEWGGATPVVLCSATTQQGIPELLDHIVLLAELKDLRANPNRPAVATVIESHLDMRLGPLATVIINTGTLRKGDIIVCGGTSGRVKAMIDAQGRRLEDVLPSGAVRVSGLESVPQVGDILQVVPSEREARLLLDVVIAREAEAPKRSFADLVIRLSEGKLKQLKVVLKADAQGSLEAIREALSRQVTAEGVTTKVIHAGVGAVAESDVNMAAASDGIVLSFHVPVPSEVQRTAEREGVNIRQYEVLYDLLDEVEKLLLGLIEPEEEEKILGHLDVRGVFYSKKNEQIVGGKVQDGVLKRVLFRIQRGGQDAGSGKILTLKHVDKDIKEAKEGSECGLRVETSAPIQEGDILEVFSRELKKKEA